MMAKNTKLQRTLTKPAAKPEQEQLTAKEFVEKLKTYHSPQAVEANDHLAADQDDVSIGVRMGQVFALAKEYMNMPLDEVEKLLESSIHEVRVGAVSIMDFQAAVRKRLKRAKKSYLNSTSDATTGSIPGIWLIVQHLMSWVVICSIKNGMFYIDWRIPKKWLSAALRLSAPAILFVKGM